MPKKIILLMLLIVSLFPITISAEMLREKHANNEYELVIDDTASLFNREELNTISENARPLLDSGNIVIKTVKSNGSSNINTVATEEYTKLFDNNNGLIVVINVYNGTVASGDNPILHNYMTIVNFGNNLFLVEEDRQQIINDKVKVLQEGRYLQAVNETLIRLNRSYENYKNDGQEASKSENPTLPTEKLIVEDDADLLAPEEEEKLKDVMSPLTEFGYIIFKSINSNDTTTNSFAHSYYYKNFGNSSGTMFLIDMDNREIYICSGGENYKIISKRKAQIITDNVYRYASAENYYACAEEAFNEMNSLLSGYKIAEPMRYASNAVISLVVGFLFTFIYIAISMMIKKPSKKEIELKSIKSVAIANFAANISGQHRVYSPRSESSGGSGFSGGGGGGFSGGGGGGGGGFSGGGGGHKF